MSRFIQIILVLVLLIPAKSSFPQTYATGTCTPVPYSQTCVDSTPCVTDTSGIQVCLSGVSLPTGALSVPQTCWKYSYQYACANPTPVDTCTAYENNSACTVLTTTCVDKSPDTGLCDSWNYSYQCQTQAAQTGQQLQCTSGLFNSSSLTNPVNTNNSFGTAAVAMEVAREMTVYSESGASTIFAGVKETCAKGYGGIKNCCKATPDAQNNASFVESLGVQTAYSAVKYAGEEAVDTVSPYVFDAMYSSGLFSDGMTTAIASSSGVIADEGSAVATNFAASGFTFAAYGFTYGTGTFVASDALSGTTLLTSGSGGFLAFNPYVLAAELVLQYVMSLSQCTQEEQALAMHKGADLSVYVGTACTKSFLGSCLETTDTYCSFNSVLAKIINQQGKAQLGLDFSTCSGLTIQQVTSIDFTKIDFSEFTQIIEQQALKGVPTSSNIATSYTPIMSTTTSGSSQSSTSGTAYPKTN